MFQCKIQKCSSINTWKLFTTFPIKWIGSTINPAPVDKEPQFLNVLNISNPSWISFLWCNWCVWTINVSYLIIYNAIIIISYRYLRECIHIVNTGKFKIINFLYVLIILVSLILMFLLGLNFYCNRHTWHGSVLCSVFI